MQSFGYGVANLHSRSVLITENLHKAQHACPNLLVPDPGEGAMARDGETVTPALPEPDVWTGMALANVMGL